MFVPMMIDTYFEPNEITKLRHQMQRMKHKAVRVDNIGWEIDINHFIIELMKRKLTMKTKKGHILCRKNIDEHFHPNNIQLVTRSFLSKNPALTMRGNPLSATDCPNNKHEVVPKVIIEWREKHPEGDWQMAWMKHAYADKRRRAIDRKRREFTLTLEDFIWLLERDGYTLFDIGQRSSDVCLCRKDDIGGYHRHNTYWATQRENTRDALIDGRISKRKPVLTPFGIFPSVTEASFAPEEAITKNNHREIIKALCDDIFIDDYVWISESEYTMMVNNRNNIDFFGMAEPLEGLVA